MGASCADGKKFVAASSYQNRFAKRVSQEHLLISQLVDLAAALKIRALKLARRLSHKISSVASHENRIGITQRVRSHLLYSDTHATEVHIARD